MKRMYNGSCHCGGIRFKFASEPIASGMRCNCSICIRRGAVMSSQWVAPDDFVLEPTHTLACYRFGDRMMNHYFCTECGTYPFSDPVAEPGKYRVNLGCVDGLDPFDLDLQMIDGRSF
jgi:hypothetical protein